MSTSDKMMTVSVVCSRMMEKYLPQSANGEPLAVELSDGSTVSDLLDQIGVPQDVAKLVFVNHTKLSHNDLLPDGAQVEIFPVIAGG